MIKKINENRFVYLFAILAVFLFLAIVSTSRLISFVWILFAFSWGTFLTTEIAMHPTDKERKILEWMGIE